MRKGDEVLLYNLLQYLFLIKTLVILLNHYIINNHNKGSKFAFFLYILIIGFMKTAHLKDERMKTSTFLKVTNDG